MAASLLLNLGARAMTASQAAISVIGHNIANVNTPGYSRQTAVLTTATPQFTGAGFQGKGVTVDTINRVYNRFLTQEAQVSRSTAAGDEARMINMQRLDKLFPPGDEGLGAAMGGLLNAMIDVTSRPSDPAARQVVLGRAQEVAARFSNTGQQLSELQAGVVSDLKASLQVVNQLATQIANANQQIARISGNDHAANDLLDQRDQLVYELSKYMTVSTLSADDGSLSVFIGGGQLLVLGNQAQQLALTSDPYDALRVQVSLVQPGGTRPLDENVLQGGSVAALVHFQNEDLQDARNYVGQLATALAMRVNTQQSLGLNLGTPPVAGEDLFRIGNAKVMPATTNAKDITGNFVAGVQITRVDPDFLQASAYTLKQDASAPGTYLLTRESDGLVRTVADGDIVDGFQITFTPAAPGPLDSYRLEPVATAAIDMRRAFDNPAGIAAASPISGALRVSNTGTATLDRIYAVDPTTFSTTNLPATVQFTTVNGDGSVDYVLNGPFGTLNGTWRAGQPIGNETGIALGFELHLNGVPRTNDWIDLSVTQFVGQNNGNAKAFLALQTEAFVGKQLDPATLQISAGATLNDAYSAAMGEIGARVQGSVYMAEMSDKVAQEADTARAAEAGVNLDEEAARLLQYQQAYQAAAKVMQVAQVVFDELIRTVGS